MGERTSHQDISHDLCGHRPQQQLSILAIRNRHKRECQRRIPDPVRVVVNPAVSVATEIHTDLTQRPRVIAIQIGVGDQHATINRNRALLRQIVMDCPLHSASSITTINPFHVTSPKRKRDPRTRSKPYLVTRPDTLQSPETTTIAGKVGEPTALLPGQDMEVRTRLRLSTISSRPAGVVSSELSSPETSPTSGPSLHFSRDLR